MGGVDWDLIYLGRKKLKNSEEPWVEGSDYLVHVDYSYWTLCYAISLRGAKKLLRGDPLTKLIPVDEYIPIMFDKHPETDWKEKFDYRDLKAFSVAPLFVYPTHYTGEPGYVSDTEDSDLIIDEIDSETFSKTDSSDPVSSHSSNLKGFSDLDLSKSLKNEL